MKRLLKRCPECKCRRKFGEPPGDQGGEVHPRRPTWKKIDGRYVCGWCVMRAAGEETFTVFLDSGEELQRDVKTGRIAK